MSNSQVTRKYLILDMNHRPLTQGELVGRVTAPVWTIFIRSDKGMERVLRHEYVNLLCSLDGVTVKAKIVGREGDEILVRKEEEVEASENGSLRANLRMPVRFQSYLYSISGPWKGRVPILSNDLSSGGIAFYCPRRLKVGEFAEIVIPITERPLVLKLKVVWESAISDRIFMYGAAFLDLVHGQEMMLREAVFGLQLDDSIDDAE